MPKKALYFLPALLLAACTTSAPNPEYAENLIAYMMPAETPAEGE